MPRRLTVAVALAAVCQALLILSSRYLQSYDAYTHMFFADHYLHHWDTLWDERWYGGFTVVSYPPLVHQVMAVLATVTGIEVAYALVLFLVMVTLPVAVYAFARVFLEPESAGNAAIGAAVLPSFFLAAHVFGQLPTLGALLLALFSFAALASYLGTGSRISGALTVALFAAVVAAHHATLLFMPGGILAVIGHFMLTRALPLRLMVKRLLLITLPALAACVFVIWPFWVWGMSQSMQTPIDHLSRHNFISDPDALLLFFLPVYGLFILLIPYALYHLTHRQLAAPALVFIPLFVLGLGGTTPLPRLLFGTGWEWLTYDRFGLWASVMLLIFFGKAISVMGQWLSIHLPRCQKPDMTAFYMRIGAAFGVGLLALLAIGVGLFPTWFPTQPPQVDMRPIVNFLNSDNRAQWRYLTFGFGDQWAAISLDTAATTIDGSYHTARQSPVMRSSGIGQIDSVFWSDKGLAALAPILQMAQDQGVRWGFVDRREYEPVLVQQGWMFDQMLSNDIAVWEAPNVPVPVRSTLPPDDSLQLLTWQFAPLASLVLTGILACAWARPAATARILAGLHALSVSLLPIGLSFWVFRDLVPLSYPRIYFTYTDVLFFASDGLIAIAVVAWALSRWVQPKNEQASVTKGKGAPVVWLTRLLLALCVVATLSAIWSVDARLSLATSAHLWLLFLFYLSLKNHPVSLRLLTYGASVALLIQAGIGFVEVIGQTTAFLSPLRMQWPGDIVPAQTGASVVQLADGARWLRAYGSFPHPNILGGWASAMMMAPAGWLLLHHRLRLLAIAIVMASAALIFLSFSRSAWLGCAVGLMVLGFHWRQFARRRLIALALAALLGFGAAAIPLYRMVFTRVAGFGVATEQQSIEVRTWMTEHSLMMIGAHPWLGVGIGGFVVELVNRNPGDFLLEPAHNVALLVAAELGLPGLLLVAGIGITLAIGIFKAKQPLAVVASMMVIVLASVAAFDHFLWTIAPGRDLLWFALGIWAGWQLPAMSQNQNDRRLRS